MKDLKKIVEEVNALYESGLGPKNVAWRMPEKCHDCPFKRSGAGLRLRKSLQPGRWEGILLSLSRGEFFNCHQTTHGRDEDENGDPIPTQNELVCAGAIEWQDTHGASSAYVRICRHIDEQRKGIKRNGT